MGIAIADQPVPAVPETQTLSTTATVLTDGLVMETDAGVWTTTTSGQAMYILTMPAGDTPLPVTQGMLDQLTAAGGSYTLVPSTMTITSISIPESLLNQQVADAPSGTTWQWIVTLYSSVGWSEIITKGGIHTGILDPGEVRFTTAYDQNIVAQAGTTTLVKQMAIDTRNKPATNLWNTQARTDLTFIATADGGNIIGEENIMLDGAGNTTAASTKMLCPFGTYPDDLIPSFCNIVQTGNKYDLTIGSITSTVRDRFVGMDAAIPVMVEQDYTVYGYGTGEGTIPAIGSSMAYAKVHIQEARGVIANQKAEDITYSQVTSVNGIINSHHYTFAYQSGKSLVG